MCKRNKTVLCDKVLKIRHLFMKTAICFILITLACNSNTRYNTDRDTLENPAGISEKPADAIPEFGILTNKGYLSLRDWSDRNDPEQLLGKAESSEIDILGEGADTFMGSTVKTLRYPGLEIKMFSPKQNGKTFWIKNIKLSNKDYMTSKGIRVGDQVKKLDSIYPLLLSHTPHERIFTGRDDSYINFRMNDSTIAEIHIYYELQ